MRIRAFALLGATGLLVTAIACASEVARIES